MSQFQEQLEGLPGYDFAMDQFNEYAGEYFNNTNPYEDANGNRRTLPREQHSDQERRVWKKVQLAAWTHDRCFLGLCGVGMDCGVGLAPVATLFFPFLGPLAMYVVHARLVSMAQNELYLPLTLVAKMQANILFDFLISLPPIIGAFLLWLNGCLTRNAGMLYAYLTYVAEKRARGQAATYIGLRSQAVNLYQPQAPTPARTEPVRAEPKRANRKEPQHPIVVGTQLSGVR